MCSSLQEPSASFPSVPALLASILSFLVTHVTCTACLTTSATATAGPCSAPGVVSASPLLLASSAPWLPLSSRYPDPPAPSPDRRTAPSAKGGSCEKTNLQPTKQQPTNRITAPCVHPSTHLHFLLVTDSFFFICVCLKMGVLMICYIENNRKKLKN